MSFALPLHFVLELQRPALPFQFFMFNGRARNLVPPPLDDGGAQLVFCGSFQLILSLATSLPDFECRVCAEECQSAQGGDSLRTHRRTGGTVVVHVHL